MSVVTKCDSQNIHGRPKPISKLNEPFRSGASFVSGSDESLPRGWYAGSKILECQICPGTFNHLQLDELVAAIRKVTWDDPQSVQLFVQEQEEERLREVVLRLPLGRFD